LQYGGEVPDTNTGQNFVPETPFVKKEKRNELVSCLFGIVHVLLHSCECVTCSALYFPTNAHNVKKRRVIKTF
jgi:hypothetical protein